MTRSSALTFLDDSRLHICLRSIHRNVSETSYVSDLHVMSRLDTAYLTITSKWAITVFHCSRIGT